MLSDKGVLYQPCQDQSWNISRKLYLPVIETGLPKIMYSGGSKSQSQHEQYYDMFTIHFPSYFWKQNRGTQTQSNRKVSFFESKTFCHEEICHF